VQVDVLRQFFWFYARYAMVVLVIGVLLSLAGWVVYGVVPWWRARMAGGRSEQQQIDG
jgi:hypothetical protein